MKDFRGWGLGFWGLNGATLQWVRFLGVLGFRGLNGLGVNGLGVGVKGLEV